MFKRIAELIAIASRAGTFEDCAFFPDRRYRAVPINQKNFLPPEVILGNFPRISFCDGGNAELFSSPNISLQLVRGYFSVFREQQKVAFGLKSFYLLISAGEKEGSLRYSCNFFSKSGDELSGREICGLFGVEEADSQAFFSEAGSFSFDPLEKSIMSGKERASPSRIADIIRRYFELSIARASLQKLEKGDFILLDGTLQCMFSGEQYFLEKLYSDASSKGISVCALAKTSGLITKKGKPLIPLLAEISPISEWYYHPIVEIESPEHQAEMYIIKLNSNSNYAFRFEVYRNGLYDIQKIIDALQKNSRDYSFPGYPYGLIDADKFAQVTNEEKSSLRAMLFSESGMLFPKLRSIASSTDAHDILNRI